MSAMCHAKGHVVNMHLSRCTVKYVRFAKMLHTELCSSPLKLKEILKKIGGKKWFSMIFGLFPNKFCRFFFGARDSAGPMDVSERVRWRHALRNGYGDVSAH